MNEENPKQDPRIAEFWSHEAQILEMVTKAVAGLAIYRGLPATYAESMHEFRLCFKALAFGMELPNLRVRHPEAEVNVKADQRTSRFVFGDPAKVQNLARMACTLCKIHGQQDSYEQMVEQLGNCFDQVASAHAAVQLWGLDPDFHEVRCNTVMCAEVLQMIMPAIARYPKFDQQIRALFDLLEQGKIEVAHARFKHIHSEYNRRQKRSSTEREMQDYLISLYRGSGAPDQIIQLIDDLQNWAEKHKVYRSLAKKMPGKGKAAVVKI